MVELLSSVDRRDPNIFLSNVSFPKNPLGKLHHNRTKRFVIIWYFWLISQRAISNLNPCSRHIVLRSVCLWGFICSSKHFLNYFLFKKTKVSKKTNKPIKPRKLKKKLTEKTKPRKKSIEPIRIFRKNFSSVWFRFCNAEIG